VPRGLAPWAPEGGGLDSKLDASSGSAGKGAAAAAKSGTHVYVADERNKDVLVGIRDGMHSTFDLVRCTPVGLGRPGGPC
jgi:hypothetical protein